MRTLLIVLAAGVVIAAIFLIEAARIGQPYLPPGGQESAGPAQPDAGERGGRRDPVIPVEPVVLE